MPRPRPRGTRLGWRGPRRPSLAGLPPRLRVFPLSPPNGMRSKREGGSSVYLSVCDRIQQTCCTKTLVVLLLLLCTLVAGGGKVRGSCPVAGDERKPAHPWRASVSWSRRPWIGGASGRRFGCNLSLGDGSAATMFFVALATGRATGPQHHSLSQSNTVTHSGAFRAHSPQRRPQR